MERLNEIEILSKKNQYRTFDFLYTSGSYRYFPGKILSRLRQSTWYSWRVPDIFLSAGSNSSGRHRFPEQYKKWISQIPPAWIYNCLNLCRIFQRFSIYCNTWKPWRNCFSDRHRFIFILDIFNLCHSHRHCFVLCKNIEIEKISSIRIRNSHCRSGNGLLHRTLYNCKSCH